jgi:hypothetical protein
MGALKEMGCKNVSKFSACVRFEVYHNSEDDDVVLGCDAV